MAGNAQKLALTRSLNQGSEKNAADALQIEGKSLPCSVVEVVGSLVTVKFELTNIPFTLPNTMMPIIGSEYIRLPIQKGCKGVAIAADARLGGVTGMGVGTADLSTPGNLSALVFVPLGNKSWDAPESANKTEIWGPDGVIIRGQNKKARIDITEDSLVAQFDTNAKITLNSSAAIIAMGAYNITIDAAGIHLNGPLVGTISGAGSLVDFGTTSVKATQFTVGSTTLTGHHHVGPVSGGSVTTGAALP